MPHVVQHGAFSAAIASVVLVDGKKRSTDVKVHKISSSDWANVK
jgi:hypothetical protein